MSKHVLNGHSVVCDDEDDSLILDGSWRISSGRVVRLHFEGRRYLGVELFHRVITDCPLDLVVDHVNGDPLDNRRINLRLCEQRQNAWNRKVYTNNSSGVTGVYYDSSKKTFKPWRAQIRCDGKKINLGRFSSLEDAKAVRLAAEMYYFGEYAASASRSKA